MTPRYLSTDDVLLYAMHGMFRKGTSKLFCRIAHFFRQFHFATEKNENAHKPVATGRVFC